MNRRLTPHEQVGIMKRIMRYKREHNLSHKQLCIHLDFSITALYWWRKNKLMNGSTYFLLNRKLAKIGY